MKNKMRSSQGVSSKFGAHLQSQYFPAEQQIRVLFEEQEHCFANLTQALRLAIATHQMRRS